MSLQFTLDYPIRILQEPGFYRLVTCKALAEAGFPSDSPSFKGLFFDEKTKTLMLRPLQLDSTWINTTNQLDSVLRLGTDIYCNAADTTGQKIFEAPALGNADNPYVYHTPAGPTGAFPGGAGNPSPAGLPMPFGPAASENLTQGATAVYQPDTTMPPGTSTITQIGDTSSGVFVTQSAARMPANQPLFFRWFHPSFANGFPCIYEFYVGQYKLRVKDVVIEVFRDTSSGGDRSAWKKVLTAPLFSTKDFSYVSQTGAMPLLPPQNDPAHDRSLLWLPFRQNQVLLYASTGKSALLTVNSSPRRLPDGSDWDITRSDTVLVWVLTPAAGRFQIQKVKYPSGTIKLQTNPIQIDYTPSSSPTVGISQDADHGTGISATITNPPGYTIPTNDSDDCPTRTTWAGKDQVQGYGVELSFTASTDKRWTPFFYNYGLSAPRTFTNWPASSLSASDVVSGGSPIQHAEITAGLEPGSGRLTVEVVDLSPFPLAAKSGRSGFPVQLTDSGTAIFTGIADAAEAIPLPGASTAGHRLVFPALDRWAQLSWGLMRDRRDYTGTGHIDAVVAAAQQAGIDTSTAELPAGYVAGQIDTLNTALGLGQPVVGQMTKDIRQGWAPQDDDTPATFIKRIAQLYSGWWVGFRLDGTFYYLPRYYFTSPTVTFTAAANDGSGNPVYHDPLQFTTIEPEANVIIVKCGDDRTGTQRYSSAYVDWQSILNQNAVNFLGREKREVVVVGGTFSCRQLNWIARTIWGWTRRRHYQVQFDADFVPSLKIGQMFTLSGQGNYRLIGMRVRLENQAVHRATYEGLFVEQGF